MNIRIATKEDLQLIQKEIIKYPEDVLHMGYTGFANFADSDIWVVNFVGEVNKKVVGEVSVKFQTPTPRIYINGIYVLKNYRGKGYGEKLMAHVIDFALTSWNAFFIYGFTIENKASDGLFKKMGFEDRGVYKGFVLHKGQYYDQKLWVKNI